MADLHQRHREYIDRVFSEEVISELLQRNTLHDGDEWAFMDQLMRDMQMTSDRVPFIPEDTTEVDVCIRSCEETVRELSYESWEATAQAYHDLGKAYYARFWLNANKSDFRQADANFWQARINAGSLPERRLLIIADRASIFVDRFSLFEDSADASSALGLLQELEVAQGLTPDTVCKNALIVDVKSKYIPSISDLDSQLDLLTQRLDPLEEESTYRSAYLEVQGRLCLRRSELTGSADDLENAIKALQSALICPTRKDQDDWKIRIRLASALRRRFEYCEHEEDLDSAQSEIHRALLTQGLLQRQKASCKLESAELSYMRSAYDDTRISSIAARVSLIAADQFLFGVDTPLLGRVKELESLVSWYSTSSGTSPWGGVSEVLSMRRMCEIHQQSCQKAGWPANFAEGSFLATLGDLLFQTSLQNRDAVMLTEAIDSLRKAKDAASVRILGFKSALYPPRACGLIEALLKRIEAWNRISDKQEVLHLLQDAQAYPESPSLFHRATLLLLRSRGFQLERHSVDDSDWIQVALDLAQRALDLGCRRPSLQTKCRTRVAELYKLRGEAFQRLAFSNFSKAEAHLRTSIRLGERHSYSVVTHKDSLSRVLQLRHRSMGPFEDANEALHLSYEVLQSTRMDKVALMEVSERAGSLELMVHHDFEKAAQNFDRVVDLMQEVVTEGHHAIEKKSMMMEWSRMPTFAAECALRADRPPVDILSRLETHRSVFWNHRLNQKTDLDKLKVEQPTLWQKLLDVRLRMHHRPGSLTTSPGPIYYAQEYADLVRRIGVCEGFSDFLQWQMTAEQLPSYFADGPIVLFVHGVTCHAVIATSTEVCKVLLPQFHELQCHEQFAKFRKALASRSSNPSASRKELLDVLGWLWVVAVRPVLDALGFLERVGPSPPTRRLWWVSSGWTSSFPMHAAGLHTNIVEDGTPCRVMDAVISSYIPTLRALSHSRRRVADIEAAGSDHCESALLLGMEETPGLPDLEFAPVEVGRLSAILAPHCNIVEHTKPPPLREEAIAELKTCSIAHFACHGQAAADPLKSQLYLWDHAQAPLRVENLMNLDIQNCKLAYLSACESAISGELKLREEGLHLAGAFLMAGIPHTVATWWQISDQRSVEVAEEFYKGLTMGGLKLDVSLTAVSLHEAVKKLQNEVDDPFIWGSYVHFGC